MSSQRSLDILLGLLLSGRIGRYASDPRSTVNTQMHLAYRILADEAIT